MGWRGIKDLVCKVQGGSGGDKLIQILTGNRVIPAYLRARLPTDGCLALRRLEGYEQVQAFYLPQRAV